MGVSRTTLIREAKRILEGPLSNLGYSFEEKPLEELDAFWFVKEPNIEGGMFHIIEFAPSGFSDKDLFETRVKLIRRNFHDPFSKSPNFSSRLDLDVPLAPNLWQSGGEKFYRWHFVSLSDVRKEYKDILEKLIEYGIPFLEDLAVNYEIWRGWGLIWSKSKR
jgi:hypothetical protein